MIVSSLAISVCSSQLIIKFFLPYIGHKYIQFKLFQKFFQITKFNNKRTIQLRIYTIYY